MTSPFDVAWTLLKASWSGQEPVRDVLNRPSNLGGFGGMVGTGRSMVPRGSPMAFLMEQRSPDYPIRLTEEEILSRLQEEHREGGFKEFNPDAQPTHSDWHGPFTHGFDTSAQDAKIEAEEQAERERKEQEALAASQMPNQTSSDYWAAQGKSWDPDIGRWV